MKSLFSWKFGIALLLFTLAMLYNEYRKRSIEGFDAVTTMNQNIKKAYDDNYAVGSYSWWTAWLYAHPDSSSKPLNDFKSRVFQSDCEFRKDWATNLPPGLQIPVVPLNAELANTGYKTYLDGLAKKQPKTMGTLNDARRRFMKSDCQFLNHSDSSDYNKNYSPVFK